MSQTPNPAFNHQLHEAVDEDRGLVITIRGSASVKDDGYRLNHGELVATIYSRGDVLLSVTASKSEDGDHCLVAESLPFHQQVGPGTASDPSAPDSNAPSLSLMSAAFGLGDRLLSDWRDTLDRSSYDALYYQQLNSPWSSQAQRVNDRDA